MSQYPFPSAHSHHSPYSTHQPLAYNPSSHSHHGHGGYNYGTPLRRASSTGHAYPSTPAYGYPTAAPLPHVTQYLTVPDSSHRSKSHSRHRSHSRPAHSSHSHHGHGYSTSASYPVAYAPTAPVYAQPSSGHHHSTSHRHTSRSRSRPAHAYASNGDYYRGRTPSVGDRVRQFFGMEPSHYTSGYGDQTRRRHNSFSGVRNEGRHHKNHTTRTGPFIFGSTSSQGYVDEHGREVDHRGRPIHRY
ncbi:hypothetical protein DFH29DRAFT_2869 [Suillus ampliporus]|nr:hypothetical protein DFH29DRAFT_2869 [Suillus ampliporus]